MNRTLGITLLMVATAAASASTQEFKLTLSNLGPQPLSPLFFATSNDQFNIFSVGAGASLGIKKIAEGGDTSALVAIANAETPADLGAWGVLGSHPLGSGDSESITFVADSAHPYFSFAAMLGKTNDGFIGESVNSLGLMLFNNGMATSWSDVVTGQRAWDAGTEKDTQNAVDLGFLGGSGNPAPDPSQAFIHQHAGIVSGVGDSWQLMPNWTLNTQLADISVQAVPEPSTGVFGLLALTVAGLKGIKRR